MSSLAESTDPYLVRGRGVERPVAVLVLHGSDGQRRDEWADQFAEAGVDAMAVRWFQAAGIVEVPIERARDAARWLEGETGKRVVVAGHSKGAELALIAAAHYPDAFAAVMAWAPSSVAWYGFNPVTWDASSAGRSSWSFRGTPVPCLFDSAPPRISDRGLVIRACYERVLAGNLPPEACIKLEDFPGQVFLASGDDDQMWPSAEMASMLVERMNVVGRGGDVVHLCVSGAGHLITPDSAGNVPTGTDMGGDPDNDRAASEEIWARALQFLDSIVR